MPLHPTQTTVQELTTHDTSCYYFTFLMKMASTPPMMAQMPAK